MVCKYPAGILFFSDATFRKVFVGVGYLQFRDLPDISVGVGMECMVGRWET
jgi:hypothetical protein